MQLGDIPRAIEFSRLDSGAQWSNASLARLYAHQGDISKAKEFKVDANLRSRLLSVCLNNAPPDTVSRIAAKTTPEVFAIPDPEVTKYVIASDFVFCGQTDVAFKLRRKAIAGPYCAAAGLENDPGFGKLRALPEYHPITSVV